jgi:hypothetical protein
MLCEAQRKILGLKFANLAQKNLLKIAHQRLFRRQKPSVRTKNVRTPTRIGRLLAVFYAASLRLGTNAVGDLKVEAVSSPLNPERQAAGRRFYSCKAFQAHCIGASHSAIFPSKSFCR